MCELPSIHTKVTGEYFITPSPKLSRPSHISYQNRDTKVIRTEAHKLPCCSHKSYRGGGYFIKPASIQQKGGSPRWFTGLCSNHFGHGLDSCERTYFCIVQLGGAGEPRSRENRVAGRDEIQIEWLSIHSDLFQTWGDSKDRFAVTWKKIVDAYSIRSRLTLKRSPK